MGRMSDKIGRRIPMVTGCIISGFPLLTIPFFHEFPILLLLSVAYGIGFATVTAATPALISELTPKEFVRTAMGFLDMITDVGQTVGPIISGLIFAISLQYTDVFPSFTLVLFSCIVFIFSRTSMRKEF